MLSAYFDTCVFDNLLKKNGYTESDLTELRVAVNEKRLAIVSNILNFQETIDALNSATPGIVVQQIELIAGLVDWERFVKPCDRLLADDIRHFAWCGEAANPFFAPQMVKVMRSAAFDIIDGRRKIDEFSDVVSKDFKQKRNFAETFEANHLETASQVAELRDQSLIPNFTDFFTITASDFARSLAKKVGRGDECANRGFERFLAVPSVRMAVGHAMSIVFRRAFEEKKLRRRFGTSRDLQHSPCAAAAADVFVTHDGDLAELIRRVPMRRFRISTLRELLNELRIRESSAGRTALEVSAN